MRAAIYVRISQDRTGAGLGVERQADDCQQLCEAKSWKVVEVYVDNDVSAFSGKRRPEWERLLADIAAGEIDAVVGWHVDRLTRSPRELEDVIDLAERHGLELATVTGDIDLGTVSGRTFARMLGVMARNESEHKSERQRRANEQSAAAGKVHGGGMRPFGYAQDRRTVVHGQRPRSSRSVPSGCWPGTRCAVSRGSCGRGGQKHRRARTGSRDHYGRCC